MSLGSLSAETLPLPERLILPLRQHHGADSEPLVQVGERVYKGQCIARPRGYISAALHAGSSGTVADISDYPVPSPSHQPAPCVVIDTDGLDEWQDPPQPCDYRELSAWEVQRRMLQAGIVGMGGAGFPAAVKLIPGMGQDIDVLILNAAECEPYITCDETAIHSWPDQIIMGLDILRRAVEPKQCVIGVEDNMPEAVEALERAIETHMPGGESPGQGILLRQVPARYPAGGERQLIQSLTGADMPDSGLPVDIHTLIYNVGTVLAVYHAVARDEPSMRRVVTVTGPGLRQPRNLDVLFGTPIEQLLAHCGGLRDDHGDLLIGGPMMGYRLHDRSAPVTKTTNCVLATATAAFPATHGERACIRCGHCVSACPEDLLPQDLLRHAREHDSHGLLEKHLFACIECGCCSYVCPSHIPLVDVYRQAKREVQEQQQRQHDAQRAKARHHAKRERERLAREEKEHGSPRLGLREKQKEIAAAVERQRRKRRNQTPKTEDI